MQDGITNEALDKYVEQYIAANGITEELIEQLIAEDERRLEYLEAEYDPVTGEGLEDLLGQERVKLEISDFAVPVQYVPVSMMENKLIREVSKAGSIEKYLRTKKWKYGAPTFQDVERRIRRVRHKYDFAYWAYFCIRIKHKKLKRRVRWKLNLPQLITLAKCEEMRANHIPIALIILKARQWGGSTFCFFYQVWLMFKWNEFHSFAIAAHTSSASETILNMLKRTIRDYPAWDLGLEDGTELKLAPADSTGHAFCIKDNTHRQVLEGFIYIGTAEKPDTLRSKDISGAHHSEVGVWPDTDAKKAEDIIADIQGGLLEDWDTMEVIESTAKAPDDFFHDTWVECIKGKGGYEPIFIPAHLISHDALAIQDRRAFVRWLLEHRNDDTPDGKWKDPGSYYWWLWRIGATLEHINWYRHRRLKISFAKMCNEAPETAEQAFFTAGNHVFDPLLVAAKGEKCREPVYVGDLVADGTKGADAIKNIRFIPNPTGDLRVWEMPDDSPIKDRYLVVLDPRRGASDGADPACITVIDRLLMMRDFGLGGKPGVVAEMNYKADPDVQAYDAMRLAQWYNHALLVVESNTLESQNKDRNNGLDPFEYIMDIVAGIYKSNLYMRSAPEEDVNGNVVFKWGFHTNSSTKPKIINHMKDCLRDDLWDEPSKICIDQMNSYMEDHGKTDAKHGNHDDAVMSRAIALWICFKEMPEPTWIRPDREDGLRESDDVRGDDLGMTNL
ncbi:MAG: hypothetical protein J6W82_05385 [Bacteroidales bacterium]|nr:hypothetical protein [Bacteroidales bacterium]